VPLLSAANWGGQGLHLRGNVEGFLAAGSREKWLDFHCFEHWTEYYTRTGIALQKRFFGHFLKGEDNGWGRQPRVMMQVRHPEKPFEPRAEAEWPLAATQWTKLYLERDTSSLSFAGPRKARALAFRALGNGLTFLTAPLEEALHVIGPSAAKLFVSSSTEDADLFLVLRLFAADLKEITYSGANDPHTPMAHGWLRASSRKLDPARSLPYRPWHTHDEVRKLIPGRPEELDIEIWPTCFVAPAGYRIGLTVRGRDYEYPGDLGGALSPIGQPATGVGPFRHVDAGDRPAALFDNEITLHFDAASAPHLLLPVVPPARS
jgi:predicted acyl esterase